MAKETELRAQEQTCFTVHLSYDQGTASEAGERVPLSVSKVNWIFMWEHEAWHLLIPY